jgi:cytoskeletal protein RodZ
MRSKLVLAIGLLQLACFSVAASARAEDTTKTLDVDATRTKTVNEDGSTTHERTKTVTNPETGKAATRSHESTVTRTEDGRTVERTDTAIGPNGGVRTRETTGAATRNGDGSRSWSSTTDGSATGPKGRTRDWTTERAGTSTKNAAGGRDWSSNATRTGENGRTWSRDSSGSTWRNGDGTRGGSRESTWSGPQRQKQSNGARRGRRN